MQPTVGSLPEHPACGGRPGYYRKVCMIRCVRLRRGFLLPGLGEGAMHGHDGSGLL